MVSGFDRGNPVLDFNPKAHSRWSEREFLLWPAWAYRVVAPRVRRRKFNMLQRAVFGLANAGLLSAEEIAEQLSIHRELAAFVLQELQDSSYLDRYGVPTDKGLRTLEDDAVEASELVSGYVFVDPWTGKLWQRFVERLNYCELDYQKNGFPSLVFGTHGAPRRKKAFMVIPGEISEPQQPSPQGIVEAVSRHRRRLKNASVGMGEQYSREGGANFNISPKHFNRVSMIDEKPRPVFLMTYLYIPENESTDWYVCDPFVPGSNAQLRRRIEQEMDKMPPLRVLVDSLLDKSIHDGAEEYRKWVDGLKLKARRKIEDRLPLNFQEHRAYKPLLGMEALYQEVLFLEEVSSSHEKRQSLLRGGSIVLEAVFAAMKLSYPLGDCWKRVHLCRVNPETGEETYQPQDNKKFREAVYRGAFKAIGFEEPFPNSFLNIKAGQIRSVAQYEDSWRLRALVTATALQAERCPSHPLRLAAKHHPRLLDELEDVASRGGKAGHAGSNEVSLEVVRQHVASIYSLVDALTNNSHQQHKI